MWGNLCDWIKSKAETRFILIGGHRAASREHLEHMRWYSGNNTTVGERLLWEGQVGFFRKANDFLGELTGNNKAVVMFAYAGTSGLPFLWPWRSPGKRIYGGWFPRSCCFVRYGNF